MNNSVSQELLKFLQKSPTAFHAVAQMKDELLKARFTELKENLVTLHKILSKFSR